MGKKANRFSALRELRSNRQEQQVEPSKEGQAPVKSKSSSKLKKKVGRPAGRRSDPNYTQISAYIPLELLLSVQDELAHERRVKQTRTARPVSALVEELLDGWLKTQKRKNAGT
ncbi:MAG: hypothetical protein AAF282_22995 [Cyanobacteria bacterium P01_A01_bin.15]